MTVMVKDCYEEKDQKIFVEGMNKLQDACKKKNDKNFMECTPQQRHELLVELDKEPKRISQRIKRRMIPTLFQADERTHTFGYFTSEIGATKALRYVESPGRYEACIPYKKGDKAWAT